MASPHRGDGAAASSQAVASLDYADVARRLREVERRTGLLAAALERRARPGSTPATRIVVLPNGPARPTPAASSEPGPEPGAEASASAEPDPGGRRRWVAPLLAVAALLVIAGAVVAAILVATG